MSENPPLAGLNDKINDKGYFERILAERDRVDAEREKRLDERSLASKEAVTAALASAEKAVDAAMAAAQKAASKSEESARETLKSHNDLIRQSRDRDATYATQTDLAHANEAIKRLENTVATRNDLKAMDEKLAIALKPLTEYVNAQRGPRALTSQTLITALLGIALVAGLYFGLRGGQTQAPVTPPTVIVTVPEETPGPRGG